MNFEITVIINLNNTYGMLIAEKKTLLVQSDTESGAIATIDYYFKSCFAETPNYRITKCEQVK